VVDSRTQLCVEDDGIGPLPQSVDESAGLGHLIIKAMAEKLGATIALDRAHRGTRVVIEFS
jgi:two-component sensor histidine kinase